MKDMKSLADNQYFYIEKTLLNVHLLIFKNIK